MTRLDLHFRRTHDANVAVDADVHSGRLHVERDRGDATRGVNARRMIRDRVRHHTPRAHDEPNDKETGRSVRSETF
jgi:hypothetical protein